MVRRRARCVHLDGRRPSGLQRRTAHGRSQRFTSAALWQEAFRRTYGSELRPESEDTIRDHYEADSDRYDAVAAWALATLAREGAVTVSERTRSFDVEMQPMKRAFGRARWHLERPYSRGLALLRLLKNATTFGDWLPYILWKLERHADVRLELTERQRRHPLIFGWPILARLLWRRDVV